jgi:hypothetical protein
MPCNVDPATLVLLHVAYTLNMLICRGSQYQCRRLSRDILQFEQETVGYVTRRILPGAIDPAWVEERDLLDRFMHPQHFFMLGSQETNTTSVGRPQ